MTYDYRRAYQAEKRHPSGYDESTAPIDGGHCPDESDKHIAWDYGILWSLQKPRTTKTQCEKRVPVDQIDNDHPTCPECKKYQVNLEWLAERIESDERESQATKK